MPNRPHCFEKIIVVESLPCSFTHLDCIWNLEENILAEGDIATCSWENFWKGSVNLRFLQDPITIQQAELSIHFNGHTLKEIYVNQKVPVFLRSLCPSFFQHHALIGHPILGDSLELAAKDIKNYRLSIFRNKDFDSLK
jgi:hypothetical protein